ncbi:tyrosine-type recombinase/integrase [Paenirhodobacter populi]|uniref:tyrosine-type recombinase/integrase n=1 Tax=Paenirhodobacter populi TaxID=2306993 RepID=UPI0013E377D7|nr:integrase arm-type DNA-binding domain-containing protein [Sinirhodobacter populi]
MATEKLNKSKISKLTAENGKPKRLSDGGGLYIEATVTGARLWKMAYRFGTAQKTLSFGKFPVVTIDDARKMRDAAKAILAAGGDPIEAKRAVKSGADSKTFDEYAGEFIEFRRGDPKPPAQSTLDKYEWSRASVRRTIGGIPIKDIRIPEIVSAIQVIAKTGKLHKAAKVRKFIDQVYEHVNATHHLGLNAPGTTISKAVYKPVKRNHPGFTEPHKVGELLRSIDGYSGDASTNFAMRLAPHVFLRAGEIRGLRWSWVNFDKAEIEIPDGAMKMKRPHIVPMSRQVQDIMREVEQFSGKNELVFPSPWRKSKTISENTLNVSLRRMGFSKEEVVFHGFRTTASTLLREVPIDGRKYSGDAIEMQLSHAKVDSVEAAYNKAKYMAERVPMMQLWSDMLDEYRKLPPAG